MFEQTFENKLCVCDIVGSVTYHQWPFTQEASTVSGFCFECMANECVQYYVANRGNSEKSKHTIHIVKKESIKRAPINEMYVNVCNISSA